MNFSTLTSGNLLLFAAQHYDNATCSDVEEFNSDIAIPKYLKRLFDKYHRTGVLKDRLILNHLLTFFNVFDTKPGTRILFFLMEPRHYSILKTFLVFLERCPDVVQGIPDTLHTSDIKLDMKVVDVLRRV